jgi:hypothetical protein
MPSDGKSSHCLWQGELKTECISKGFVLQWEAPMEGSMLSFLKAE